jgi:ribosomal protein S18 acetylase RimI-like enzyme
VARAQLHHRPRGDLSVTKLSPRLGDRLTLRGTTPRDQPFLRRLHAEAHAAAPLADAALDDLVALQYEARDRDLARRFPRARDSIVLCDGEPAGRLWIDTSESGRWRVLDLAVVAERRRHGIATAVLDALITAAEDAGAEIALTVERRNTAAVRLYLRLGFEDEGGDPVHRSMIRRPSRDEER